MDILSYLLTGTRNTVAVACDEMPRSRPFIRLGRFFGGIITLRAIYGIIGRRTEANILHTSLEFGRFSKIAAKMKLCTRGKPWFFVIL